MINRYILVDWLDAKSHANSWKKKENELRKEICLDILEDKAEGTKHRMIEDLKASATAKINLKVDKDELKVMWGDLSLEERKCIRFKPEINMKEYRKLSDSSLLKRAVVLTPGMPTLAVKAI